MDIFSVWVGVALHNPNWDRSDYQLNNPVGIVEVDARLHDRVNVFLKHESGITTGENGYGSNQLGIKMRIW